MHLAPDREARVRADDPDADVGEECDRCLDGGGGRHRSLIRWRKMDAISEGNMSDTNGNPDVMTLEQGAGFLQISKAHLSNIINGKVPGVPVIRHARVGRRVLIRREWADAWLEEVACKGNESSLRAFS